MDQGSCMLVVNKIECITNLMMLPRDVQSVCHRYRCHFEISSKELDAEAKTLTVSVLVYVSSTIAY